MYSRIKNEWVKRLRSGKYKQTHKKLGDITGHCCLGVLCEIAVDEGVIQKNFGGKIEGTIYFDGLTAMPSVRVEEWANLTFRHSDKLSKMNDEEGLTFSEIADYIEKNL